MRIAGKRVVVTGASSGIGRATAVRLAKRGADVLAVGRDEGRLAEVASLHERIEAFRADVTIDADRAALIERAGAVDILVNNAGIGWTGLVQGMAPADARTVFETNVLSLVDLTQRVLPGMLDRRHGHICNVASIVTWVRVPPFTVYAASKAAVQAFSDGLRREVASQGIAVSCLNPGPINTRFLPRAMVADREEVATGTPGLPPLAVALAVERAVWMGRTPGYGQITVPRPLGMLRIFDLPVIGRVLDVAGLATGVAAKYGG